MNDTPVAMVDRTGTPTLYFIHTDQIGTPQKLTDGSMNVVWDGVADPFGNSASGASLALTNLRFPGQYFDGEAALNQNWNRDYDPAMGRYIQSDPWGLAGGINTFAYVGGNPMSRKDPEGKEIFSGLASAGLNIAFQTFANYEANGGNLSKALRCVNPNSVAAAFVVGAVLPGFGSTIGVSAKYLTGWFGGATGQEVTDTALGFGLGSLAKLGIGSGLNRLNTPATPCGCDNTNSGLGTALHHLVY